MNEEKEESQRTSIHIESGDISGQIAVGGNISQEQRTSAGGRQGDGLPDPQERPDQVKLRNLLRDSFSEDDLRDLCFDLGLDYDNLPGDGKAAKAREIVIYFGRRQRLPDLAEHLGRTRPDLDL
ncbi:MAG: hypothetical protein R3300_20200 [Candidatus Promineifilaceae bacterium]|nr:hypothetical protein [Candidatus Promineifilaceae bacterium]